MKKFKNRNDKDQILNSVYCPIALHRKDVLVCKLCCPYNYALKCKAFHLFEEAHGWYLTDRVDDYLKNHGDRFTKVYKLEVKKDMKKEKEELYIGIKPDGTAIIGEKSSILASLVHGTAEFKRIFKVAQELQLTYQLMPKTKENELVVQTVPKPIEENTETVQKRPGRKKKDMSAV